jgi:hypothetical protein
LLLRLLLLRRLRLPPPLPLLLPPLAVNRFGYFVELRNRTYSLLLPPLAVAAALCSRDREAKPVEGTKRAARNGGNRRRGQRGTRRQSESAMQLVEGAEGARYIPRRQSAMHLQNGVHLQGGSCHQWALKQACKQAWAFK